MICSTSAVDKRFDYGCSAHLDEGVRVADGASVVRHQVRNLVLGELHLQKFVTQELEKTREFEQVYERKHDTPGNTWLILSHVAVSGGTTTSRVTW